ncbi:hypothetical protein [Haloferula sp. A504]|uniref:hypothetical protein n=1 Tax=Haloferula sp. A504 TaxID=3373601 RepID=UPI0031BE4129|nr:hypothetical protein [Verrucomicrobiaceae bacterium E54]
MKLAPIPSLIPVFLAAGGLLHAAPLVYEGFDYETGGVGGNNGGTGFTGAWSTVKAAPQVTSPGLSWGSLEVAGNSVIGSSGTGGAARDIGATSVLDSGGLMGNGETLWFSVLLELGTETVVNVDCNFSLGTDGFANYIQGTDPFARRLDLQSGEGIGFALSNVNSNTGRIDGAYWQDDGDADSYANRVKSTGTATFDRETSLLIVGKIDWGADDLAAETLTLYAPDASLNLGTPVLAATSLVALDQSAFDTVAFQLKADVKIDEIRFGATSDDVLPVAVSAVEPRITSITSVGQDLWELTLVGDPSTDYEFYSSTTLDFTAGALIENLVQGDPVGDAGTVGGTSNSVLTTDANGDGKVRVTLTGDPRDFVRAQSAP